MCSVLPTSAYTSLPQRGLPRGFQEEGGEPGGEPPVMFPALLLLLVDSTHPSTFPERQLCENKTKGSLGNPVSPVRGSHNPR